MMEGFGGKVQELHQNVEANSNSILRDVLDIA